MAYCPKCGKETFEDAEICPNCGRRIKGTDVENCTDVKFSRVFLRFLLTFILGFIGSFIINHSGLRPKGWRSRTCAYFFLSCVTLGIYGLVASFANLSFNPNGDWNIGYFQTRTR